MNRIEAMQIFVRVAELSSFSRAADLLQIPKASASTAVQGLEASLGTRLLHRTTRRVQLTQDGSAYYERCKDLLADLTELDTMFERGPQALRGTLRVDMPSAMAIEFIIPRLPRFLDAHPQIELELGSADHRVDLVRDGFDCVLRVGPLGETTLVARPLGSLTLINCASPAYLARHGTPQCLDDLSSHALVHYVTALGAKSAGWEYVDASGAHNLSMRGAITVNNVSTYRAACLAGLGIVQAPAIAMRPLIADGKLVEVLPQFRPAPMPVSILYAHRRNLSKRVRVFMDWIAEALVPYLDESTGTAHAL
jgi:DNA-binding transcriptional LysR family regulator